MDPQRLEFEFKPNKWNLIVGTICGLILLALLIAILIPSRGCTHCLANRASCAANLHGIMESLVLYAADNNGHFPAPMPPSVLGHYSNQPTPSAISAGDANAVLASYYNKPYPQAGEPTASLWMLVLRGQYLPKYFLCKSDTSGPEPATQDKASKYYDNFSVSASGSTNTFSYSIAYPWTRQPDGTIATGYWWKDTTDSSLPLVADMAPLSGTGGINTATTLPAIYSNLKDINSPNHAGQGQNVAYGDVHVEWHNTPYAGRDNDNIWTIGTGTAQTAITTPGITPIPPYVVPPPATMPVTATNNGLDRAPSPVDIIMVPVRNVATGKL